jgi:Xaa-Pro aminopeptidase
MSTENLLLVADSERDADMLYAVGMFLADPFVYLQHDGQSAMLASDLELDRARREARGCRVLSLSRCLRKLKPGRGESLAQVVRLLARERRIKKFLVPENFPYGLARELRRLKIRLKVRPGTLFFPEREFKTADEVKKISAALMMAEVGMAEAIQAVRNAKIGPGAKLLYRGAPLTSERLRAITEVVVIQAGGSASHTIVAGGRRTCDPHDVGSGPLYACQPIIIDIFPRSQKTGYHGDITRTIVKGRASEALRELYQAVKRAQQLALRMMRVGRRCREIHDAVARQFDREGYRTGRRNGRMEGFFHGTGHGVGLELHEPPQLTATSAAILHPGHVITAEPGLYYPELGGVRLEDMVVVTRDGAHNLTKFEKVLEV